MATPRQRVSLAAEGLGITPCGITARRAPGDRRVALLFVGALLVVYGVFVWALYTLILFMF